MGAVLLSGNELTIGYADGPATNILFEELTVSLQAGELVCFMGPNGVGKSTLIRTLAGLQPALKGTLHPHEINPTIISVVLTDKVSSANMTAGELIAYGRYPYLDWNIKLSKLDHKIIDQAIATTHTQPLLTKKLYELSDGQLQLVMIARALAQDTPVILLDEPTAHLDLNNRVEIMNLLRTIARTQHKAILVATHELDLALQTADFVWLAGNGKKILTGIPEDLVLDGSFDDVFQFKGFDLKTGKVAHHAWRNKSVALIGDGPAYLWTKNALERSGYQVNENAERQIKISTRDERVHWDSEGTSFQSLRKLLNSLLK
jgi:iron complex transport system ATP-binding protein